MAVNLNPKAQVKIRLVIRGVFNSREQEEKARPVIFGALNQLVAIPGVTKLEVARFNHRENNTSGLEPRRPDWWEGSKFCDAWSKERGWAFGEEGLRLEDQCIHG